MTAGEASGFALAGPPVTPPLPSLSLTGGFFDWWQIETPLGVTCWRSDGRVVEEVPKKWRL